jgi:antiviral helicase SKI2
MLMQDGTSRGNEPTIKVLEIAQNQDRKADDLLPYLGPFAKFFRNLPKSPKDLILKTAFVPLNDIECFTKTIIDIPESVQNLNRKKDTLKLAQDQFLPLCQSWNYEDWDEYDYGRIKSLKFRELMETRVKEGHNAVDKKCLECPNFLKHFEMEHDQWVIKENIHSLRQLMSDQNLQLLPDYEQRIRVLKDLGFIDDGSRVELKGKVACEVPLQDSSNRPTANIASRFTQLMSLFLRNLFSRTSSRITHPRRLLLSFLPLSSRKRLTLSQR